MTTGIRKPHDFCWINMLTPNTAQACVFFEGVLGWSYQDMGGMGYVVQVGGRNIGGMFDVNGPGTPSGTRAHIGVMIKVHNADDTVRRIAELGGRTKPPFDIMQQGRMAVCYDPNGAEFDIWQSMNMQGTDVDSAQHGAPSWFDTVTTDVAVATKFYCDLFGWTSVVTDYGPTPYSTFSLDGVPIAGMIAVGNIPPHETPVRPHWGTYFTVNSADEAAAKAVELGGVLSVPLSDIPGVGRWGGIESPQGVPFYVMQYVR